MPTQALTKTEAQLALLAIQKKQIAQAAAQQAYNLAEQQFIADVAIITSEYGVPDGTAVNFHVENGVGTLTWPDISPAVEVVSA